MLDLLVDQDFNERIVRGLVRRLPDLEPLTARAAGLSTRSDAELLRWAGENGRTVLTHDVNTMIAAAGRLIRRGGHHGGVIVVPQSLVIGVAIEHLWHVVQVMEQDEMRDHLVHLPL